MPISRVGVRNHHGFTMIELGMVLLVLGIVGALIIPRYGGMLERQQMRRTINTLRGTVRYLQAHAAHTKRIYRLQFDLENQVMSACYLAPDSTCQPEATQVLREYTFPDMVRIVDVINPQGEKTREGEAVTHFHPTGIAEPSIIHLATLQEQYMTLIIEPLTGNLRVQDGYVEPENK
jgi:prepilin-type N-terminal cleavage/methylation domain-containing protein